jgi:hypothetical protein
LLATPNGGDEPGQQTRIRKMIELLRVFWQDFKIQTCVIAGILIALYLIRLVDAHAKPWSLWRQEWDSEHNRDQSRVGSYQNDKLCIDAQQEKLTEELKMRREVNKLIEPRLAGLGDSRSVLISEGNTIFEYRKSLIPSLIEMPKPIPVEMQTEISASVSFFCWPTASFHGLWPYRRPSFDARSAVIERVGARALSIRAKEMLDR